MYIKCIIYFFQKIENLVVTITDKVGYSFEQKCLKCNPYSTEHNNSNRNVPYKIVN